MSLTLVTKERALEIGFDLVGIAPLGVWKDLEFSRRWIAVAPVSPPAFWRWGQRRY